MMSWREQKMRDPGSGLGMRYDGTSGNSGGWGRRKRMGEAMQPTG